MRTGSAQHSNGITCLNPVAYLDEQTLVVFVDRVAVAGVLDVDDIPSIGSVRSEHHGAVVDGVDDGAQRCHKIHSKMPDGRDQIQMKFLLASGANGMLFEARSPETGRVASAKRSSSSTRARNARSSSGQLPNRLIPLPHRPTRHYPSAAGFQLVHPKLHQSCKNSSNRSAHDSALVWLHALR